MSQMSQVAQRWLLTVLVSWTIVNGIAGTLFTRAGFVDQVRIVMATEIILGVILAVFGLVMRIAPPGPGESRKVPALLGFQIVKAVAMGFVGVGFLSIGWNESDVFLSPSWPNSVGYGCFCVAGSAKLFLGAFLALSVGRGWIFEDLYIWPFGRERE